MIVGQQIFIDISQLAAGSIAGSKYLFLILDDASDYVCSIFLEHKSYQNHCILDFLSSLKARNTQVSTIRCDNLGENNALNALLKAEGYNITFEFTSPSTPQ
jgi:hypothetical protein